MDSYLTTDEVAAWLRRTPKTIRQWRYLGIGPTYISTGKALYAETDVQAWLDACKRGVRS